MNNYENERMILEGDVVLASLCKAYTEARRIGAHSTQSEIRSRTIEIYQLKSYQFTRFVKASFSLYVSRRAKLSRLEKRINSFLEAGSAHFITLTWNDDALKNNSALNRKKFVRSALNETCADFIANIDFGKTTHREHYHCVTLDLDTDSLRSIWKPFGFVKIERVIPSTEGSLALYVDKLCNHALKETTCKNLMYCRKKLRPCKPAVSLWTFTKRELDKITRGKTK